MFSGIIESVGEMIHADVHPQGATLQIQSSLPLGEVSIGDSIAVDGCCLTVTQIEGSVFWTDLS